jgi:molybdate transport system substrate-binding protein
MEIIRKINFRIFCFLVITYFALSSSFASAAQIKNLTVLAEPNLVAALTKISRIYSQKNAVIVSVGFASAASLISDIDSGEPSDVFISAHQDWVTDLKQKGLVDIYNVDHIASDELLLVASRDNLSVPGYLGEKNTDFEEALKVLDHNHLNLIVDNDESSLGKYSNAMITAMQLQNIKLFTKLSEDKSLITNLLQDNLDSYAILLASQVNNRKNLKVLARKKTQHIFYQALVIAGDNMDVAREFLKFLKSAQAKAIFRENGFVVE